MVKVEYFETATMRKTGKMKEGEIRGEFFVNIQPEEIPEVPEIDESLTGEERETAIKYRNKALEKREKDMEQTVLDCKFRACDMVRELTGPEGVLVASIPEPEEKEEK